MRIASFILLFLSCYFSTKAQVGLLASNYQPFHVEGIQAPKFKINTKGYGAILGFQRGKYTFFEFGAERNWKTLRLIHPRVYAVTANVEYNFEHNVIGYKVSGWTRRGRIALTYGVNLCYYTNFDQRRVGGGPVIGFKLLGFHLTNGYNFTVGDKDLVGFNPLYISLRYFFPIDSKIKFERKHKKNRKKKEGFRLFKKK